MPPRPLPSYAPDSVYHQQRTHLREQTINCLRSTLTLLGLPASMLDVGCGEGAHVAWARDLNIDAFGVDLAAPDVDGFLRHNLCEPLHVGRRFEWVLCWEVAEHLPPQAAETLCDTLARHLEQPYGRLLFTAAPPGQSGPGHINCQPKGYWRALLEARGLHWQPKESALLGELWLLGAPKARWYGKNLQVFAWA